METHDGAIEARLDELDQLETVSPFSRSYYRLISRLITMAPHQEGVRIALCGLLEVELRYHRELRSLTDREEVALADLQASGERHRIGLNAVRQYAARLEDLEIIPAAVCDLVLAECHYHLKRTADVIAALERVIRRGVRQPLVQFALGYNRYLLALETCTEPSTAEDGLVILDPAAFRVQCLQAVSALEDGLQGTPLDAQLYWWIGVILEAGGLTEAAQDAYDKSAHVLHPDDRESDQDLDEAVAWRQQTTAPEAITDEEVRQAELALERPFDPARLHGPEQDDR